MCGNGSARLSLPVGDHLARFTIKNSAPKIWKFNLQDEEKVLLIGSASDELDSDGKREIQLDVESSHIAKNIISKKKNIEKLEGPRGYVAGTVISIENNTPVPSVKIYV